MGWFSRLFGRQSPRAATEPAKAYLGLRGLALGLREKDPALLGATADQPLAILMETALESGTVVTLMAAADTSTSLYFSTGGGIIGTQGYPPVAAASRAWLAEAQQFAAYMTDTTDFPLPAPGRARFYIIYSGRVVTAEAAENDLDLGYERHALAPLFHGGHAVIAQIRLHSPR